MLNVSYGLDKINESPATSVVIHLYRVPTVPQFRPGSVVPSTDFTPTGGGLGSSFLQNLCKIANSQKLDRYFCFCHKNGLLMFQDLVDFEAFLNCKENTKLKARTFRQLHRQIVLRGFTEVVDEKMNSMSTVAYVHPNKEMMNLMRNEVKERKNCCRRHYKLVT